MLSRAPRITLTLDVDRRYHDAAVDCEAAVFGQWYGETAAELQEQYEPWDDVSVFIVAADELGDVHGAVRLLPPSPAGSLTLRDIGRAPWNVDGERSAAAARLDLERTWDIATLGARTTTSGPNLSAALIHGLFRTTAANGITGLTAILDDRVRRLINATGLRTRTMPGTSTQRYYGSEASTPIFVPVGPVLDLQRRIAPDMHRLITMGVGLDGVTVEPAERFVLPTGAMRSVDLRSRSLLVVD